MNSPRWRAGTRRYKHTADAWRRDRLARERAKRRAEKAALTVRLVGRGEGGLPAPVVGLLRNIVRQSRRLARR